MVWGDIRNVDNSVGVTGRNGSHPITDNGDVNDKYGPHPVCGHVGVMDGHING